MTPCWRKDIHHWGWALIDNKSLTYLQFSLCFVLAVEGMSCQLSASAATQGHGCCHSHYEFQLSVTITKTNFLLYVPGSWCLITAMGSIMTFSWVFLNSWSWYFVHGKWYKSVFFYMWLSSFSNIIPEDGVFVWMEEGHTVTIPFDSWWLQGEDKWVLWKCRRQTLLQRVPHTHAEWAVLTDLGWW